MNKKFLTTWMIAALLLTALVPFSVAMADDDDAKEVLDCVETLDPIYKQETQAYLGFLEQTFKNKSADSSLTNIAILRYRKYREALNQELAKLEPNVRAKQEGQSADKFEELFDKFQECKEMTDVYIMSAKQALLSKVAATSLQKKATIIVEKYKGINSGLSDLNAKTAFFYAYYEQFHNKLPGFLSRCMKTLGL